MYWNVPGETADAATPVADAPIVVAPIGRPLIARTPLFASFGAYESVTTVDGDVTVVVESTVTPEVSVFVSVIGFV